jgi:lysophospholipase L1-like esterase
LFSEDMSLQLIQLVVMILATVAVSFAVLEVGLRSLFGFGNPLIYIADEQIGYLLAPNQRTRRYGNRIEINQYSMRSEAILPTRSPFVLRVLLLGDSIANGGWWTDQNRTISSLLQHSLLTTYHHHFPQVEVLNASANSWGPTNELAYLQRFGTFEAQAIVLLINTDDLFATAPTSLPVGRDRNYPVRKPPLAVVEVLQRYLQKPKLPPHMEAHPTGDRLDMNLQAIAQMHALANANRSCFLLAMTPLKREVAPLQPRHYEIQARQRLEQFTKTQHINYIDFLPIFNSCPDPQAFYHDHIHLNKQGNQLVSKIIEQNLSQLLNLF